MVLTADQAEKVKEIIVEESNSMAGILARMLLVLEQIEINTRKV